MTPECNGPVTGLVVSDPMHLLALHKAIMEAKFHESPENQDVLGSPLLASIADQVMDAIINGEDAAGNTSKAAAWRTFRRLSSNTWIADRVRGQVVQNQNWRSWDDKTRIQYITCAVAPFQATESKLDTLRQHIDLGIGATSSRIAGADRTSSSGSGTATAAFSKVPGLTPNGVVETDVHADALVATVERHEVDVGNSDTPIRDEDLT